MIFSCPAAKRRLNGRIPSLLAAAFLLLAAAASLHAGGSRDEVLSRADTLIEEKEYDEAVRILSVYMKNNPEKFNESQKRLKKIVGLREQYNTIADELLDTLEKEPENYQKILDLTNRLTGIESASNLNTRDFLARVRVLADFNNNRLRLEEILNEGRVLLAAGNYREALNNYVSGLDIYRDDYFASGFGGEAETLVSGGLETIGRAVADFASSEGAFSRAATAVGNLGNNSAYESILEATAALKARAEGFSLIMEAFTGTGNEFDRQFDLLRAEHPELGDASFLPFASRLIHGPTGQNEGMIGSVDRFWKARMDGAEKTLENIAKNAFARAGTDASLGNYGSLPALLDNAERTAALNLDLLGSWQLFYGSSSVPVSVVYDETVPEIKASSYLLFHSMLRSLGYIRRAAAIGNNDRALSEAGFSSLDSWRQGILTSAEVFSSEETNRTSYNSWGGELDALEDEIRAEIRSIENYRASLEDLSYDPGPENESDETPEEDPRYASARAFMEEALEIAVSLNSNMRNKESGAIVRAYTISTEEFEREVTAREGEFAEGRKLMDGVPVELPGVETYNARYPAEALAVLTEMRQRLVLNIASGRTLLDRYAGEDQTIVSSGEMASLYAETRNLFARLETVDTQGNALSVSARNQIARADALRLEGDRLYQESQTALARDNFEAARERLERATSVYHESLSIQESPSLRASWDSRLLTLGADIVRTENEIVVRDVRALVTQARTSYYRGDLPQAEDQLVRAQNRWSITNAEQQPEVVYWLTLVRGALSIQSARTISVTAPLYAETSQLMSDARKNFNEGERLISLGRRREGIARLNDARQKTMEVRLMFPMNQDARLLDLRIDQVMDPEAFNAAFTTRINEAVAGTKPNTRSAESFALLQDLAAINPAYPGIQRLINQAEIDMGYRPPPPDPRAIARSDELTRLAKAVADARNSTQYPVAIAQLDEALQLNPSNNQAEIIKDQIQTWMTGTGTIVLDNRSYDEYTRALTEFQRGNTLIASSIVEQLLQNPRNRNSTLILELQRRIQSVL